MTNERSRIETLPWTVTMDAGRRAREDERRLRLSIGAALLITAGLLAVRLPMDESPPPDRRVLPKVFRMSTTPRVKQPAAMATEVPNPRARRVPVPAPLFEPAVVGHRSEFRGRVEAPNYTPSESIFGIPAEPPPVDAEGPIRVAGEVVPPRKIFGPEPVIPPTAARIPGAQLVILEAIIDREGVVQEVEIVKAAPLGLDRAAVTAVRRWRFEPATLHGRPVAVRYHLTVKYRVD